MAAATESSQLTTAMHAPSLKRSHHDSFDGLDEQNSSGVPAELLKKIRVEDAPAVIKRESVSEVERAMEEFETNEVTERAERERSSSAELSDVGSRTPSLQGDGADLGGFAGDNGVAPSSAFAMLGGSAQPPPKKARLTFQEREQRKIEKEIKDRARAEEKAKKEKILADEKARKDAEREAERKIKEVQKEAQKETKRLAAEQEKAAREAKRKEKEDLKRLKDEEKRLKDEEKRLKEEEKKKKEGKQMKLAGFFGLPAKGGLLEPGTDSNERNSLSPAPSANPNPIISTNNSHSPQSKASARNIELTPYAKLFPSFFVHADVVVAKFNRFERDQEAMELIEKSLDSVVQGITSPDKKRKFEPEELFHLSRKVPRGKMILPVRDIMEQVNEKGDRVIDLTTDSQNSQIKRSRDLLSKVPVKFLHFQEDVRPPYRGTYTSRPTHGMAKLARNPLRKDLPDKNYDYDSEAEWVEEVDDAEDLKSEADDEDELEEDEDMEDFLDDEGDELAGTRRPQMLGDLEPISTGLCWEDRKRRNENVKMISYRMENILDPTIKSIDPFSTTYWPSPKKSMDPPRPPLNAMKQPKAANANTKDIKSFLSTTAIPSSTSDASKPAKVKAQPKVRAPPKTTKPATVTSAPDSSKPRKVVIEEDMQAFKDAIRGSDLSKIGLIEVLKKQFPKNTGAAVKNTLEIVAKRAGAKEADKRWVVLDEGGDDSDAGLN